MTHTKGKWVASDKGELGKSIDIFVDEESDVVCSVEPFYEQEFDNARLITAAVNACQKVNPENPIAAAEALPGLLEALKQLTGAFVHIEGDTQGNKAKTAIIPHIKASLNAGWQAIAAAEGERR